MFYRCGGGRQPSEYRTCPAGTVYYAEYQVSAQPLAIREVAPATAKNVSSDIVSIS